MRLRPWLNSQHEMFDVMHSRATDRRSASKCQGKWPDQTLDQAFGLPEVLVAVASRVCLARGPGKRDATARPDPGRGGSGDAQAQDSWQPQRDVALLQASQRH